LNSYELITYSQPRSFGAEAFKTLRANLQFFGVGDTSQAVLLAGGGFGEGASFVVANLGIVFAQTGQKVIIVDCDLRKPRQHMIYNVSNQIGLTSVLSGLKEPGEVLKDLPAAGLKILTSGPLPTNPTELLGGRKMSGLISELKKIADVILLDAPPLTVVADAAVLSKSVDGVLIVVRSMVASRSSLLKTKELLTNAKANIIGVAFNCARMNEIVENYQSYYEGSEILEQRKEKSRRTTLGKRK